MTPHERNLLYFLQEYMAGHDGVSPTVREMQAHLGLASPSGVSRLIDSLERQRLIARDRHCARSIRLTRPPTDLAAVPGPEIFAEAVRRGFLPFGSQYPERGMDA